MSTKRLVTWITFLAIFAMAAQISIDSDVWWHLRTGEWIVQNRAVPKVDPFSFTRVDEPWRPPYWIMQVQLYIIFNLLGPGGVNLWTAGLVTLAFYFVWKACSGSTFLKAFTLVLAAATSGLYWAARPYMLTFVLSAVYIWILEDYRWGRKNRLYLLPILMILWTNGHGGYPSGFILWGIYFIGLGLNWITSRRGEFNVSNNQNRREEWRKWSGMKAIRSMLLVGLLSIVCVALNPHGIFMYALPFQTVSIQSLLQFVQEWQSPNFHDLQTNPFIWMLLISIGAFGVSRRKIHLTDLGLFVVLGFMGLYAARNIAIFALAAPVFITRILGNLQVDSGHSSREQPIEIRAEFMSRWQKVLNVVILSLVALTVLLRVLTVIPSQVNVDAFRDTLPIEAVSHIQSNLPRGRLLNHYNWGGDLMWALPEYPVFIDGRTDLYGDEYVDLWLEISRGEDGWQSHLDRWDINLVLLPPEFPLVGLLELEGWDRVYADQEAVLYGR